MVHLVPGSVPPVYHTKWTPGDGNCMFSAFARGLNQDLKDHVLHPNILRGHAVYWMAGHSEWFVPFVSIPDGVDQHQAFKDYLKKMIQPGEWGDDLVLNALSQKHKVNVGVLKRRHNGGHMWTPSGDMVFGRKTFWLYLSNHHYENLLAPSQLL
jgi:hypothetical protein